MLGCEGEWFGLDVKDELVLGFTIPRDFPLYHFVEDAAKGVDVAFRSVGYSF